MQIWKAMAASMIELQYLDLLQKIISTGDKRTGRNGDVFSLFGATLEHDLAEGFPLLTTKRMFWKGIVEELAWFLRGSTDVSELHKVGVHIWDGNTVARSFDAGPVYGFQWRHYDADYTTCTADYQGKGTDQIAAVIDLIKENPTSRRIILSAWNPRQQSDMCLPPCHIMYQFYVRGTHLDCQMYQRSADAFLGLPFNIASTALLTHLIAHETGLEAGKIRLVLGDVHVYEEHVDVAMAQVDRKPFTMSLPHLAPLEREKDGLWNVKFADFNIMNYRHLTALKAVMKA